MVSAVLERAGAVPARGRSGAARIDIRHVSHQFDLPQGTLPVLDDVSLAVAPGEFVALLGPSGCGKSTLLRLVAGLESATSGTLTHDGLPISRPDPSRIVVFQDPTLYPWRTVWDNVALGLQARGVLKAERGRVDDALARVGLSAFARVHPHQLSGGMAQRVALARALVNDPSLLVLDEPLGKLDSLTRLQMQSELLTLWQRDPLSVMLVTHDVEEALFLAQRVILLGPRPARIRCGRSGLTLHADLCWRCPMSSVVSLEVSPRTGLKLNPRPFRKDWFDEPAAVRGIDAERRHRQERLACAFRIFARYGFDQGLAGHITARDPELPDHFWVNPFGLHFSRIKVSDLLLVNSRGEIALGSGPLNRAAFAIHAAIHEARPEVVSAAHTHSLYGKAWSSLGRKLDALTQDSCAFYEDHGLFDDFSGVVYETDEGSRIAEALGTMKGVILKNHGILTAGPTVEAAAWWYIALDNACHAQLLAEAAGKPQPIPHEFAALTHGQISTPSGAARAFDALWQGLVEAEPELLG